MRTIARLAILLAVLLTAMVACRAAAAPASTVEHYDPAQLNQQAVQRIRRGDLRGAAILLERAALLAPHDARVRANLQQVRAALAGQAPPAPAPAGVTAQDAAAPKAVPPAPPPLWRKP